MSSSNDQPCMEGDIPVILECTHHRSGHCVNPDMLADVGKDLVTAILCRYHLEASGCSCWPERIAIHGLPEAAESA